MGEIEGAGDRARCRIVIFYRSMAGGEYPARILAVRQDGTIDIELDCGLALSRIVIHDGPERCEPGEAYVVVKPAAAALSTDR